MDEPKVRWHVTMSLDGFIAGPDDEMDWLPRGGGVPELARHVIDTTGAILIGRRMYDKYAAGRVGGKEGIYGGAWQGPVLVLTRRPAPEDEEFGFVAGTIEDGVSAALNAADGRGIVIFGATLARLAFDAGLVDEVVVHIAPVLLGAGIRLPDGGRTYLEPLSGPADLHYRVAGR
ncbi:deaminase [Lentzea sp. NBRC 105346]|uniref:dihydrofolate reductase family protein n=1 Tax=Lentzea sp. NBRC 105346 TaxID=3032205 RepID=UPI0024A36503|nr:dihydrofolate reductase family protein [Lentzea sp. NBRC 105346]GLZ34502.1 deaminase [Lentzea sp. NBRC 105346]